MFLKVALYKWLLYWILLLIRENQNVSCVLLTDLDEKEEDHWVGSADMGRTLRPPPVLQANPPGVGYQFLMSGRVVDFCWRKIHIVSRFSSLRHQSSKMPQKKPLWHTAPHWWQLSNTKCWAEVPPQILASTPQQCEQVSLWILINTAALNHATQEGCRPCRCCCSSTTSTIYPLWFAVWLKLQAPGVNVSLPLPRGVVVIPLPVVVIRVQFLNACFAARGNLQQSPCKRIWVSEAMLFTARQEDWREIDAIVVCGYWKASRDNVKGSSPVVCRVGTSELAGGHWYVGLPQYIHTLLSCF
jgi:hypothetical protein